MSGRTRGWAPDIAHPRWALEIKSRKNMPVLLRDAMDQAQKAADWIKKRGEGYRVPVVIIHQDGTRHLNDMVVLTLADFLAISGAGVPLEELDKEAA